MFCIIKSVTIGNLKKGDDMKKLCVLFLIINILSFFVSLIALFTLQYNWVANTAFFVALVVSALNIIDGKNYLKKLEDL